MNKNKIRKLVKEELTHLLEQEEKVSTDVAKREKVKSKLGALDTAQSKINTPPEAVAASVKDIETNLSNIPDKAKNRVLTAIINKLRKATT